jgi:thiol-disulfide isomerase/thioredoxin
MILLDKTSVPVTKMDVAQNLAPIYEQLGDAFGHAKDKVIVAKIDADGAGKPLGQKYGVTGFPSSLLSFVSRLRKANNNSSEVVRCSRVYVRL